MREIQTSNKLAPELQTVRIKTFYVINIETINPRNRSSICETNKINSKMMKWKPRTPTEYWAAKAWPELISISSQACSNI